jgi:hypothetical protein
MRRVEQTGRSGQILTPCADRPLALRRCFATSS